MPGGLLSRFGSILLSPMMGDCGAFDGVFVGVGVADGDEVGTAVLVGVAVFVTVGVLVVVGELPGAGVFVAAAGVVSQVLWGWSGQKDGAAEGGRILPSGAWGLMAKRCQWKR
jgi:hypothetical protein